MFFRDIKLFLRCLISSLALLILIGAICLTGAMALSGKSNNVAIKVAVADNEGSVISRILINAVKGTDYISKLLQVEQMDEASAVDSVKNDILNAAVVLPENYLGDIAYGRTANGHIYISDSIKSYAEMIASIAGFGEKLLASAQQAVFSGEHFIFKYGLGSDYHSEYLKNVNLTLMNEALSANSRYMETEELSYYDTNMAQTDYFVMCYILLFLFLTAISFSELFTKDMEQGLLSRLSAHGINCFKFFLPKVTATFIFRLIIIVTVMLVIHIGKGFSAELLICSVLTAIYISVITACISVCFDDCISSTSIVAIGGTFLCGAVIPKQLLPRLLTFLGDFTPFGGAKLLCEPIFSGEFSLLTFIVPTVYLTISVILMRQKFHRVLSGGDN